MDFCVVAGNLSCFFMRADGRRVTPYPPPLGPLQGAGGVGRDMDWRAGAGGFPSTLSRRPQAGDTALTTWLAARRGSP